MKNNAFTKALEILNPDEKLAINLVKVERKSTWEAGEIMKKSHYKFLEILGRAHHFITIFTQHWELHTTLVPVDCLHPDMKYFRAYLTLAMTKRLKISEIYAQLEKEGMPKKEVKEAIHKVMNYLKTSNKLVTRNFYNLICEFDKWNNFRILPKEFQEPSAFKRRHKRSQKRNLTYLLNMPPHAIALLVDDFALPRVSKSPLRAWVPVFNKEEPETSQNLLIYASLQNKQKLTQAGYPYYKKEADSADMLKLLFEYFYREKKSTKFGIRFWPKFREALKKAENYHTLENLLTSRKYTTLFAFDAENFAKRINQINVLK